MEKSSFGTAGALDEDRPRDSIFSRPTPMVPPADCLAASANQSGAYSLEQLSEQFWHSAPRYSEPPAELASDKFEEPLPKANPVRRSAARLLFVALFVPALALLLWEVAAAYDVSSISVTRALHVAGK